MTLKEAVEKVKGFIIGRNRRPNHELLVHFVHMVELNDSEWLKVPDNDSDNQKWADFLLPKAKQLGWFRLCVEQNLLPKRWLIWPHHNATYPPKLKVVKDCGKSVRAVSGGAIEQNRRKH